MDVMPRQDVTPRQDLTQREQNDARLQELYARWLDFFTKAAFAVSLITLFLYLSGAVPAFVGLTQLPEVWVLPVDRYLDLTGAPRGWAWLRLSAYGDYLNLIGICLYALVTLFCYLRIIPALLRCGERVHAALAIAQALVLLAAALAPFA
jgi:hypothetical protein